MTSTHRLAFALVFFNVVLGLSCKKSEAPAASASNTPLMAPAKLTETAPASYRVRFTTTQGEFVVEVTRDWAPVGADRFYNLVKNGYYTDTAYFRVVDGFMVQFGISGDPALNTVWRESRIQDDPVKQSNTRGMVTFATSGPDSRTTQVFINFGNNANLDAMGFAPFGKVAEGMEQVDALYNGYGEGPPRGEGPNQMLIHQKGNPYLRAEFPKLDYTQKAELLPAT